MALLNMDLLFPKKKTGTNFFNTNYDVSIVAHKGHNGKPVFRFTFINKGLEVASKYQYVVVSSVTYSKCNIYFQFLNNKLLINKILLILLLDILRLFCLPLL